MQIDIDGSAIGMRYPTEVNIVADAAPTLEALIPQLDPRPTGHGATTVEKNVARLVGDRAATGMLTANPVNPMRVAWELSERLPDNAIVTADSGSSTNWYARCVRFRDGYARHRCRARWPPWAARCPTPSAPSSRTPTAR